MILKIALDLTPVSHHFYHQHVLHANQIPKTNKISPMNLPKKMPRSVFLLLSFSLEISVEMKGQKLKFLVIFASLSVINSLPEYTAPGEIGLSNFQSFSNALNRVTQGRIAAGTAAKQGEVDEFCYLSIQFAGNQLTCGCFLIDSQHIVTAANCIVE